MTHSQASGTPACDIIVIGGGSAGLPLAVRLAEAGKTVTLIEAGRGGFSLRSHIPALMGGLVHQPAYDWMYKAEPDQSLGGRADVWPAGKRLGGGSAINGMMFIRGHRHDYDHWASLGAAGWDYESVLPFFRRLEDNERGPDRWRGAGGPIAVGDIRSRYAITEQWMAAAGQAGYPRSPDLNGELAEGVDLIQLSQRHGARSATTAYLKGRPKALDIRTGAQVQRIVFDGRRATGVVFNCLGETRHLRAREAVVLSAGALNTPRLLMLSGIGPAGHLAKHGIGVLADRPGVGQNLQEHPGVHLVNEVSARTLNDDARGLAALRSALSFVLARKGALTTGIGHAQAFIRSREGLPAPNLQLAFSAFAFDVTPTGNLALREASSVSTFVALMRPKSRGSVGLRANDPAAPPMIAHQLLADEDDRAQIVEGLMIARQIMAQAAIAPQTLREVRPGPEAASPEALAAYVGAATIPMYHPVGTARMGAAKDPMSVVAPDCRVIGVEGLFVADASIMPTIPQGNTNATSIMIGERASALVLESLRKPVIA